MAGGLMQLVAYGAQDVYLTGNPQITFFKIVYKRHTNFASEAIEQTFSGNKGFNQRMSCQITKNGDLVTKLYLNDPLGRLGEDTNQEIEPLKGTSICFSDLDNDADSDLIISGYSPIDSTLKTLVYINEPTGNFRLSEQQINFGTIFASI